LTGDGPIIIRSRQDDTGPPHTLSIPVVQIVRPRNGLGHVSTKLVSSSSGASDSCGEGGGVRRACVLASCGLAGRSFTPGTYGKAKVRH